MRVLAVGAHPDDLEILCGGTLARFVAEGHSVVMCHVSDGNCGSFEIEPPELARVRNEEAAAAAAVIGARHEHLGLNDGEVSAADRSQQHLVVQLFRDVRPDVVITHSPDDYMVDHNETSKLIFDCSFLASLPHYGPKSNDGSKNKATAEVAPLYYMETVGGIGFAPHEYVDISAVFDQKVAMLEEHRSQLTWLSEHDHVDMVDQIRTVARYRGYQCGVTYAEGFVPSRVWLRARAYRLLP